jgi:Cu(I)/Ag(I) efflux system membrane protein CusA/SilA
VAEVASFGGFVKQYQVTVDPNRLRSYGLSITDVADAVRKSNQDVGGRLLEMGGREFMVRGRGYVKQKQDLEAVVLKVDAAGTPVLVRDVAWVALGPEMRRGVSDFNGRGDVAGGVIVMRHGENARAVIDRVKARLADIKPSLPKGVRIVTTDRSDLIERAIDNLEARSDGRDHHRQPRHPRLPLAHPVCHRSHRHHSRLRVAGVHPDVPDGDLLQHHVAGRDRHLHRRPGRRRHRRGGERLQEARAVAERGGHGDFHKVRLEALLEVGPSVFFSLLVIAVAFLPIFTLVDQEGASSALWPGRRTSRCSWRRCWLSRSIRPCA